MTLLSPKSVTEDSEDMFYSSDGGAKLLVESEKLEREFEQKAVSRGLNEDVVNLLRKAISLQEVYIDRSSSRDRAPAERLMKLRTRLQNIEAKPISETISQIERNAKAADEANRVDEASKLYAQAYVMQNRINLEYSLSKFKSVEKAMYYDSRSKLMKARPLYQESVKAEKSARAAMAAKKWEEARREFERTISLVSRLNSEFPDTAYTDFSRLQTLDSELESLKSTPMYMKLEAVLKRAEEQKAKKNYPAAAELYGDAAEIQRSINKVYPRSLHASEDNLKLIERQKNDAFSWDYIKEINSLEKKLYDAINKKDLPLMMEISSNLLYKAEQFKKDFPRSDLLPEDTILKLRYIKFMGRDIPQITQLVQENLIGISANKKMLKTEVWQDLYKAVMKENPSRNTSEGKNPVDSVSYDDAERFCTRLSWLMAAKVSLPTEAEFKDAVGSLRYVDINAVSWNNFNSDGMTHPVATKKPNDKGFYDLLGNVEEFVKRAPDAPDATLMGGSITSTPDSIVGMAKSTIDRKGRKRTFGFRITVEK